MKITYRTTRDFHKKVKSIHSYNDNAQNLLYQAELQGSQQKILQSRLTIQEKYGTLLNNIKASAEKYLTLPITKTSTFSIETVLKINERASLNSITNKSDKEKEDLRNMNKTVKKLIRRDIRREENNNIKQYTKTNLSIARLERHLSSGEKNWISQLKQTTSRNEKTLRARKDIVREATAFYSELYRSRLQSEQITALMPPINDPGQVPPILTKEIEKAISSLKNNKSAGPEGIPSELLKIGVKQLGPLLTDLFNSILEQEVVPDEWLNSTIILLFKKGNINDINNYRPITLTSNIYKIFAKILLSRLTQTLDSQQPVEQAGFRKGYSTCDHLHTMQQVVEKVQEYNQPLYIAFIDFTKAFDSIEHCYLWQALDRDGIPHKYIRILKNIYEHSTARIRLDQLGYPLKIERGLKQGDCLSPKFFNCVLEHIFRKQNWHNKGLKINGRYMSNIRFADDIVLFSNNEKELQEMLNELNTHCGKVGLQMNKTKTKIMSNTGCPTSICLDKDILETIDSFTYLGKTVSFHNSTQTDELNKRISNAWKRYWSLKYIFKNTKISMTIKSKVFNTCILPILTYGAQTWAMNKEEVKRLKIAQRKIERSILGVRLVDKIRKTFLRGQTKVIDTVRQARKLKWKWAGHVMRQLDNRWTKESTVWCPRYLPRRRGRPRTRWRTELEHFDGLGVLWTHLAINKNMWKKRGEAFARIWDDL